MMQWNVIMRPSSLGGGRILRRTLSVCLSVRPVIVAIGNVFSSTAIVHGCTLRHALRAAYRTAISAAQILVMKSVGCDDLERRQRAYRLTKSGRITDVRLRGRARVSRFSTARGRGPTTPQF